ncbi:MAG: hypothetical protein A2750_01805 [Candidatus Yanofskybacteria bacterium RIFCSPHIGHO2_01_FULL_45_42]|uniref:FAD-binding FR-type domain-containing protein n=2 Tax=Candidatus Yanofskyibacteriota TaxID=1752733 RepID=A0A1F8F871_9BACT|nr:MAG: hypothetical protein A2750_01805 [Candidatus Yanofskybacteria bacterium RIFCSPHIGHO2_01_FULL_45_42]OGN15551.1 MAG: hypothetical protein A3C81_00195 [Candidatus Yanofskybacteria bacterium RIFCSPHIGHO2_02_FULL_46_19]
MNLAKKGTIISVKQVAKRTIEVAIKVPADFSFRAGQWIQLILPELKYPDLKGNTRMFSIASSPNRKGELNIIFRSGPSGYKRTLTKMEPGTEVIFSGPYGSMELPQDTSRPFVIIAGGVGVAPFLSMIRFSSETASGHKVSLIYANIHKEETAYLDELLRIEKENPDFKLLNIFGQLKNGQLKKAVNGLMNQKAIWSVIGPQGFVDFVGKYLLGRGVNAQDVVFEQFYPELSPPP